MKITKRLHKSRKDIIKNLNFKNILLKFVLILYAIIQVYPLIWLILFSFKTNSEIFGDNVIGLPKKLMWQNYKDAFFNGNIGLYFTNSLLVSSITIIVSGILAAMVSYAVMRMKWKCSKIVLNIFLLGLMLPNHAALLPLFIIFKNFKILSSYLALILPYIGYSLPMAILILTGFLHTIPADLEEAAFIDGCSVYKVFLLIVMPLLRNAMVTISIFTFLLAWNEFVFAFTFISKNQFKTITAGVLSMVGKYITNWGAIGAGMVIATLPTILVYIFMSSQVQKSLLAGSIKA